MKGATSLRTLQDVARYGKTAGHPLCLAALDLWRLDAEVSKGTKDVELSEETVNSAKQLKENAQALIKQVHKERNEKEANQVSALLRKIDNHLLKAQKRSEAAVQVRSFYQQGRRYAVARFERERDAAICVGKKGAFRALGRVRKRWSANEARLKAGNLRKLETLNLLRDKVFKAARETRGLRDGYLEAARGGDRALSDEDWQGRLTAKEIHSRLVDAGVFSRSAAKERAQLHEIRRLARKLPLRLEKDQPGRKKKWPYRPKQEPKRPLGRPHTKPDMSFVSDTEGVEASKAAAKRGKIQRARIAAC